MAAAKKRRWLKGVIAAAVVCGLVAVGVYVYVYLASRNIMRYQGPPRPPAFEISLFPYEYALHVSGPLFVIIGRWYAPWSERPNLEQIGGSLRLPPLEDWSDGHYPFRDVVIETNLEEWLQAPCFSPEAGLYRRMPEPGEAPAFVSTTSGTWSYVLRHDPDLTPREARLTFELQGSDPASGETRRERHHLHLAENPKAGSDVNEPAFLITSHTIERLPGDETPEAAPQ